MTKSFHNQPVIVVGAGISGLTAAYHLHQAGFAVTVLEASANIGGRMTTVEREGFRFDTAAIVLTRRYRQMLKLAAAVGMESEIVSASSALAIPCGGNLNHVYADSPLRNLFTGAVSWRAKLSAIRLLRDVAKSAPLADWYDLSRLVAFDTESVQSYLTRLCDSEMRDALIGPLYRGLYLEEPQDMSVVDLLTILNNFYGAPLFTFRDGIGALPRKLADMLDVRLDATVLAVEESERSARVVWRDGQGKEHISDAAASVIALPAPQMAAIYPQLDPDLRAAARAAKYSRILNVQLALTRRPKIDAVAIMLPQTQFPSLYSIYLDHNKNPGQMPAGRGMATVFWRHDLAHHMWESDDGDIVQRTADAATEVLPSLSNDLLFGHVTRHQIGITIPAPGDYRRLAPLAASRVRAKRIHIAGDYLAGGSTNAALCSGEFAAQRVVESLG